MLGEEFGRPRRRVFRMPTPRLEVARGAHIGAGLGLLLESGVPPDQFSVEIGGPSAAGIETRVSAGRLVVAAGPGAEPGRRKIRLLALEADQLVDECEVSVNVK